MGEPEVRRSRPAISCTLCRRRKIRCNRERPCSNCIRSKAETCVYETSQPAPAPRRRVTEPPSFAMAHKPRPLTVSTGTATATASSSSGSSTAPSSGTNSYGSSTTPASTPASQSSGDDAESQKLKLRVRQLEEQLASLQPLRLASNPSSPQHVETTSSRIGGTFHMYSDHTSKGRQQSIIRGVTHKARFFGQSHWWIGGLALIRDALETIDSHLRDETSNARASIVKCKTLAREIKARRAPPWPLMPTAALPPKPLADALVECYLQSTETVHRILHIPSFLRSYEALWAQTTAPDMAQLIQLKLVLALGAVTYDDTFSLRQTALYWVYEAKTWISEPRFKMRLSTTFIQTKILLLLAQERVAVAEESMWISMGSLVRTAMALGLHRDPYHLPQKTALGIEMHRRLWNTIMELALQSSLASGGSPLISLDDCDTASPSNFDDDQLEAEAPFPHPTDRFTQTSVAIALRKTFPQRLAVVKFLNDLMTPGTYEETLRLDSELRAAYRELTRTLQTCTKGQHPGPSAYDIHVVEFIVLRYFSALHVPYFGSSLAESNYAFTRKVLLECWLKIWRAACPAACVGSPPPPAPELNILPRLVVCSAGFYRICTMHALFLVAIEIRAQVQEDESLIPSPLRPDLLSVLEQGKKWCMLAFEAGEVNVKGYLMLCMLEAQIDGLLRGLGDEEVADQLVKSVERVAEDALPIMERVAATYRTDTHEVASEFQQVALATPMEYMEPNQDWDYMALDALLSAADADPMSWMFNDELGQSIQFQ